MTRRFTSLFAAALLAASALLAGQSQTARARDFWNKEFADGKALVDKEPSPFLISAVTSRKPGTALDLGTGQGRNAVYLAGAGWEVTGVDVSDVAIEQAKENARARGVAFTAVVDDLDKYDFGKAKWDLITSFYMHGWHHQSSTNVPKRIYDALKPGGLLVIEGFSDPPQQGGFKTRDLARDFKLMRILQNDQVTDRANWYVQDKTPLVRFVATKP